MSEQSYNVTYRVGLTDMNVFFGAWFKRTWFDKANWKRFGLYSIVTMALLIFTSRSFIFANHPFPIGGIFASVAFLSIDVIVVSLFFAFFLVFALAPGLTYLTQMLTYFFGPMRKRTIELSVSAAGIRKTSDEMESDTKWHELDRVVAARKTVLLFTSRNSATLIPKSAFSTSAEADAFAAFAKAQWADAHSVF